MPKLPETVAADTWLWACLVRAWCHAGMQTRGWMWPLFGLAVLHGALWGRLLVKRGDAYCFWPYRNRLADAFRHWQECRRADRDYPL